MATLRWITIGLLAVKLVLSSTPSVIKISSSGSSTFITACNSYSYYIYEVTDPCKDLKITVKPAQGQADIYVAKPSNKPVYPTADTLTWASFDKQGTNILDISHWEPLFSPGNYYIGIYGDCFESNSTLKYTISADQIPNSAGDLLEYPNLGINQRVLAEGYAYYQFCIPYDCATVDIYTDFASNATLYPNSYVDIDTLLSRVNRYPEVTGNVYQGWVETISTSLTDPSIRDLNGFLSGTYYVAVYGWCTPANACVNNATCGPCRNYGRNGAPFNISLNVVRHNSSDCSTLSYQRDDGSAIELTSGQVYSNSLPCGGANYYKIAVPDPCTNFNLITFNMSGDPCCQNTDTIINQWPVLFPGYSNPGWSDEFWQTHKNITIPAWDPQFFGGYNCGPAADSLCYLYVGLHGWCEPSTTPPGYSITYKIQLTLSTAYAIFGKPQVNQIVTPGKPNHYKFCVREEENVVAKLSSFVDTVCSAGSEKTPYDWYQMVISPRDQSPDVNGLVWRMISSGEYRNTIHLPTSLLNFKQQTYYLAVTGSCQSNLTCDSSDCSCPSCAKLDNPYTLLVDWANETSSNSTVITPVHHYHCKEVKKPLLSDGAIAGIVIAIIAENVILVAVVFFYCLYCRPEGKQYDGVELRSGPVPSPRGELQMADRSAADVAAGRVEYTDNPVTRPQGV